MNLSNTLLVYPNRELIKSNATEVSSFIDNLNPKEWEKFCEVMLRQHYKQKNFHPVPDQDGGDLGLEFFTVTGTLFQCYYPEQGIEMSEYKKRIQKKINNDLKKLKSNEKEIAKMLGDIVVDHWVLLTPENKSKDFISYCIKKQKEVIKKGISFIDEDSFTVKIETASTYHAAKLYAQSVSSKAVDIPLFDATVSDKNAWQVGHATFSKNVKRKSEALIGSESEPFQGEVIAKYIQIEKFLDRLREDHPDLHGLVENTARAQLDSMKVNSLLSSEFDKNFVANIVKENKIAFQKHSKFMSDSNTQSLSFGYLSKWLAECYMDFK